MITFDWRTTQDEHDNPYPPREMTPDQEKRNERFCMKLVMEDARLYQKEKKKKAKQELRAAQKALNKPPKCD
jgi:hypothetical protein